MKPPNALDALTLARMFHETYERLAPQFGYETREQSRKPWEQVPENNRKLMTAVCAEILEYALASEAAAISKLRYIGGRLRTNLNDAATLYPENFHKEAVGELLGEWDAAIRALASPSGQPALAAHHLEDETTCPRCEGSGKYQRLPNDDEKLCALCDGTGKAVPPPFKELVEREWDALAALEAEVRREAFEECAVIVWKHIHDGCEDTDIAELLRSLAAPPDTPNNPRRNEKCNHGHLLSGTNLKIVIRNGRKERVCWLCAYYRAKAIRTARILGYIGPKRKRK